VRDRRETWHEAVPTRAHFPATIGQCPEPRNQTMLMGRKLKMGWSFRPVNEGAMGKSRDFVTSSMG
jgi:hypothetical protein